MVVDGIYYALALTAGGLAASCLTRPVCGIPLFIVAGQPIGLIRFGSRMDVHLGPEWEIVARQGGRVRAGSSVIARRRAQ